MLNKKYIANQNTISVSVIELFSGFVFISVCYPFLSSFLPQTQWFPSGMDWLWIIILGVFCTSIAYVLSLNSLKELSAFVANLSINLEPVYGILFTLPVEPINHTSFSGIQYNTQQLYSRRLHAVHKTVVP